MTNLSSFRTELLKKEVEIISQKINHFDNLRLKTRQMAILLWVAVVGFALKDSESQKTILLFLASALPLPFWYIESSYRQNYTKWSERFKAIRDFVQKEEFHPPDSAEKLPLNFEKKDLTTFVDGNGNSPFPLFDFWGKYSIDKKLLGRISSFKKSFFYKKIIWIYYPMTVISLFLAFKEMKNDLIQTIMVMIVAVITLVFSIISYRLSKD